MSLPVRSNVTLAFVEGIDEAEMLPESLDPVVVENGLVILMDLIEDELLLALPQVAMHPPGECVAHAGEHVPAGDEPLGKNPFAVLAELKRNDK
jgi:uncharacterized protein